MSYSPFTTAAYTAFVSFADIAHRFYPNTTQDYYYREEQPRDTQAWKMRNKHNRGDDLRQKVTQACNYLQVAEAFCPIIYSFSRVMLDDLLNTTQTANEMLKTVVDRNMDTDLFAKLQMSRIDYLSQCHDFMVHDKTTPKITHETINKKRKTIIVYPHYIISYNPPQTKQLVHRIFDETKDNLTPSEHAILQARADTVDDIKGQSPQTRHIIAPVGP